MSQSIPVYVTKIQDRTPYIREFSLAGHHTALLPFSSGSHIVVDMRLNHRTLRNAYSLINDPDESQHYQIAIRLQQASRGGSKFMHQQVEVGDILHISAPLNLFALHAKATHHVFIAGGIGITPFLSHIKYLTRIGGSFELHYACRPGVSNAYEDMLVQQWPNQVHLYSAHTRRRLDSHAVLRQQPLGSHVYICGPNRLIEEVQSQAHTLGWSPHRVHVEAFAAPPSGEAFEVFLTQHQRRIAVAADFSLLEALEQQGISCPNLCRGGVCGQCVTSYSQGEVEHFDHYLTAQQQAKQLMVCVSRAKAGTCLHLDL